MRTPHDHFEQRQLPAMSRISARHMCRRRRRCGRINVALVTLCGKFARTQGDDIINLCNASARTDRSLSALIFSRARPLTLLPGCHDMPIRMRYVTRNFSQSVRFERKRENIVDFSLILFGAAISIRAICLICFQYAK